MNNTRWNGYKCFLTYMDAHGNLHPGGAKYTVFRDGWLVGEFSSQTGADLAFHRGGQTEVMLKDYKGIDERGNSGWCRYVRNNLGHDYGNDVGFGVFRAR